MSREIREEIASRRVHENRENDESGAEQESSRRHEVEQIHRTDRRQDDGY